MPKGGLIVTFVLLVIMGAGLSGLGGTALNRWWGGLLLPPTALIILAVLAVRTDHGFLPGVFFLPVILGMVAPGFLIGTALSTAVLLGGRVPGKPFLRPEIRRAALLWGLGCSAASAGVWLL